MIERAFARTFRNYSTLFLLVAVVVFPLHLVYGFVFRNVIATSDFHEAIQAGPRYRQVRSVGPPQIDHARLVFWVVAAAEAALLPFAIKAATRVFDEDDRGEIPTVPDAWSHALDRASPRPSSDLPTLVAGTIAALAVGVLVHAIGARLTELVSEDWRWTTVGVSRAVTLAAAAPFFLGAFAPTRAKEAPPSAPKLY